MKNNFGMNNNSMMDNNDKQNRKRSFSPTTISFATLNKKTFYKRRKICPLKDKYIDYKNLPLITKFLSEGGRILPCRITSISAKNQRKLKNAIKIARILALIPFINK